MKKVLGYLFLAALLAGGGMGAFYYATRGNSKPVFRTAAVTKGGLQANIGATGTIVPEEVIDVGAQVQGRIESFDKDLDDPKKLIDYGSFVEEGTVLAQIDPAVYQSIRNGDFANLERAKADLLMQKAKLIQAQREWERAQVLLPSKSISQSDYDLARSAFEVAQASVSVSQAQILQAEAALKKSATDLDYTTIRAPVKGVILDRRVNIGQTVVASLQAPSLFLLAKDLSRLQILAQVNEADIGQIKTGQQVKFTVDAVPMFTFEGKVLPQGKFQTRLNAASTQNVVTYTVVVNTDNAQGLLLPYMTANVQFVVAEKSDALLVPNAALRWIPRDNQVAPEVRAAMNARKKTKDNGAAQGDTKEKEKGPGEAGLVWVVDDEGYARPIPLRIGYSDGVNTEILRGDLPDGAEVIVGEGRTNQSSGNANPFTPQMFGKK